MKRIFLLAVAVLVLTGCPDIAKQAYSLIVGAKAFTDKVAQQHPECATATTTTAVCVNLHKAVAAKDLLIDATEAYCAGPNFNNGGSCDQPAKGTPAADQATAKLQAAIAGWNQASADLKGAAQ